MSKTQAKIILITGTSSGFGLLIAARLASKGHTVIASMRNPEKKIELLSEVNMRGGRLDVLELDLTDDNSIAAAINQVSSKYDRLDVVINNAGYALGGFFEDLTEEEIREQLETNFFGVQKVTRAVIPLMRPQKNGLIINISSIAGCYGAFGLGAYNASKWALEGFSESLYHELSFFGIKVCLVEPGSYPTKIFTDNARYAKKFNNTGSPYYEVSQYLKNKINTHVADLKKNPEDVARIVEKLVNSKNPRFRNFTDLQGKMLIGLRKILPFKLYTRLYRKAILNNQKFNL